MTQTQIKPSKPTKPKKADNDTVNVSDNINVNNDENGKIEFLPPSIIIIEEYFLKKLYAEKKEKSVAEKEKIAIDEAEKFHNYYEGIGWMVKGSPIAKWENVATGWFNKIGKFEKEKSSGENQKDSDSHLIRRAPK